jgi:RNA polymerase sigma-70 factor (ECF subfamily)
MHDEATGRVDTLAAVEVRETLTAEQVVAAYSDLVYSLARRLTRNDEEARDLFQESFVRIFRGLAGFEGRASMKTWICQVVINCDRNRRRFWSRLRRNLPQAVPASPEGNEEEAPFVAVRDPSAGPERLALSGEIRSRVDATLRELPVEQRIAVVMRDVEGMSYEEIAAAMGIAIGTVKSKISRARSTLREKLADLVDAPRREAT